ncbi:MAG: hypothetical protein EBQ80_05645 [Proteobacteria bacterium]|nr:hypothetical protein [Pseudomonadota bacterium]
MPLLLIILEPTLSQPSRQLILALVQHGSNPWFISALTPQAARAVGQLAPQMIYNAHQFIPIARLLAIFPHQPVFFVRDGKLLRVPTKALRLVQTVEDRVFHSPPPPALPEFPAQLTLRRRG